MRDRGDGANPSTYDAGVSSPHQSKASAVHAVAAAGFGSNATRYESGRPGYPPAAVDWLCNHLGIDAGSTVLDVGAGTGKLARLLEPRTGRVIAVEPVAGMRRKLTEMSRGVELVAATAEHLPFSEAGIDAITVAQAFHWFDADRAWREFRRVLKAESGVGLIWNARDRTVEWVDAVWTIMDDIEKAAPWRNHDAPALSPGPGFSRFETATFWQDVAVSHQVMLDRVASVSHVAVLPDQRREAVLRDVLRVMPEEDGLFVRYRVDVYATRAVG